MMENIIDVQSKARTAVASPELARPDWTKGVPRDTRLLWLDKNENTDPILAGITSRVLSDIDPSTIFTYPECTPLYNKLSNDLGVPANCLLLTHGSDGGIRSVYEAFINPGDVVVHTVPTFAMYAVYSQMYDANVFKLEYRDSENGPLLSLTEFIEAIKRVRPKLVCLPNPDSPTGTVFAPEELREIIEACGSVGALILIDEAYYPFYSETCLPWIEEYHHLAVTRTFAKAWGLAGLRIGYVAACPEMIQLLHKVRPMYEVNTIAVAVVEKMLDYKDEVLKSVERLNAAKSEFLETMRGLGLRTFNSEGNFMHVAFGKYASEVHSSLKNMVLYRQDFSQPCLKGYSRFTSTTKECFKPVIERIKHVVEKRDNEEEI